MTTTDTTKDTATPPVFTTYKVTYKQHRVDDFLTPPDAVRRNRVQTMTFTTSFICPAGNLLAELMSVVEELRNTGDELIMLQVVGKDTF